MRDRSNSLPDILRRSLSSARRKKKLSQAEIGKRVGLPQMHISQIETGQVVPRYDTLLDLVRVLDHDLLLVPRDLVPVIEALIRQHKSNQIDAPEQERPLYEPDAEEEEIPS
jgi:HTH-type transcriptional regulator/antitoxin HipB